MDEAQAHEEDNHTKASESLHNVPDPAANATTTWGMFNTTCHRQQPPEVNDRPTGASSAIAEAANGDRHAVEPQEEAAPPTPFGQPLPPATERLRRKSKKTYRTRLIKAGIEPRCYGGPGNEGPLSDDAIIACLHGFADECMSLFMTLERMSGSVWNTDMTDLSDALVNTMAATLANSGSFSDTLMVIEIAGDDSLDDLRCKLKRAHFSRRRPSYERPTEISSACIVARSVSETDLDLRHKNRG